MDRLARSGPTLCRESSISLPSILPGLQWAYSFFYGPLQIARVDFAGGRRTMAPMLALWSEGRQCLGWLAPLLVAGLMVSCGRQEPAATEAASDSGSKAPAMVIGQGPSQSGAAAASMAASEPAQTSAPWPLPGAPAEVPGGGTSLSAGFGPRYRCDGVTFAFPDTWDGDKIEHVFIIHNDGDAPLEILTVQPTCGCTLAGPFDKSIAPGGQGRITATLDTAGRSGDVVKQINVTTNDPANEKTVLTFTGKVRQRISIDPPGGLLFGRYTPEMPLTRTVTVTNNTTAKMKLVAVPASQPGATTMPGTVPPAASHPSVFAAEVNEIEPGKTAQVIVTAKPPFAEGLNNSPLKFKTGIPEQAEVKIPCYMFVPPLVEITPPFIMVRPPLAQEMRRTVLIRYNGEGTMKITSAQPEPPTITAKLTEQTPGKAWMLQVTLPSGLAVSADAPAKLVLATDLKDKPTLIIDIRPVAPLTSSQPTATK